MTEATIDPVDLARALEGAERLKRIMGDAPAPKPAEPTTPGEFAARAIWRNRQQER